jgi:hypothetical protein
LGMSLSCAHILGTWHFLYSCAEMLSQRCSLVQKWRMATLDSEAVAHAQARGNTAKEAPNIATQKIDSTNNVKPQAPQLSNQGQDSTSSVLIAASPSPRADMQAPSLPAAAAESAARASARRATVSIIEQKAPRLQNMTGTRALHHQRSIQPEECATGFFPHTLPSQAVRSYTVCCVAVPTVLAAG